MRIYTTHFPPNDPAQPERPPVLIPDGFSGWGLVLGWIALLRPGGWLGAVLALVATLLIGILDRVVPAAWVLLPGLHLAVASFGGDWRRRELALAGFRPGPVVAGPTRDAALLRLVDRRPDLLGQAP